MSDSGNGGSCQSGVALDSTTSVAVSPDGASVYVVSKTSAAVSIFDRNTTTGALTQKAGTAGCVSFGGSGGACQNGVALAFPSGVAVSPDGKSVYVASTASDAVAIFDRDTSGGATNGALTQKAATAGCVSEDGTSGTCQDGVALDGAIDVVVSPDNQSVYVISPGSDAVAVFDRNTTTGALTQKPLGSACVSETGTGGACGDGVALDDPDGIAVSPNGAGVYVVTFTSDAVAILDRNTVTGALTQKGGTAGCVSEDGTGGACQDLVTANALNAAQDVAVSPDGASVYVASFFGDAAVAFDRNTTDGSLTENAGTGACVSQDGIGPCQNGVGLNGATGIAVTPDGASVYVASRMSDAVAVLDRNSVTGALTPRAGTAGCISETGGECDAGIGLDFAFDVATSPDNASVYAVAEASDAVTIFDREPIRISLGDVSVTEGNSGQAATAFTISLSAPSDQQVTVDFAVSDGTATAPADYAASSGTASFPADDATEQVSVQVNGDTTVEPDETFNVGLSSPANATIADNQGVGTILNDDALPAPDPGVDSNPPETTITAGPKAKTRKKTAEFGFASSEAGSTFECSLDDGPFETCSSPESVKVKKGKHSFEVRAKDAAGNADPTPASASWKVKKRK